MPDDETVNQMIARHEEEFDLFMVSTRAGTAVPPYTPCRARFPPARGGPGLAGPSLLTPHSAKGLSDSGAPARNGARDSPRVAS